MDPKLEGYREDNILALLVTSDQYAPQLVMMLSPELFSTPHYQKIAETAFNYINKYGKAPSVHLRDLLEVELTRNDANGRNLNATLLDIEQLAPNLQPEYVLGELEF